jgi:hypothetical protein
MCVSSAVTSNKQGQMSSLDIGTARAGSVYTSPDGSMTYRVTDRMAARGREGNSPALNNALHAAGVRGNFRGTRLRIERAPGAG